MKKLFKQATAITASVIFFAGIVIAVAGIPDFDLLGDKEPVLNVSEEQIQKNNLPAESEKPIQSFSADIEADKFKNTVQLPMIILIFGFTVIIAGVNYWLREKK